MAALLSEVQAMIEKPPHGQPCNNCGQCCAEVLCPLAVGVFGEPWDRQCPALEPDGERFNCGLVVHPMVYAMRQTLLHGAEVMSRTAAHLIGAGRGCDAQLEDEPADEVWRAAMRSMRNVALTDKCLKAWGLRR
jgi:hypothetical protein